jgi:DNA-binding MarR family transcriptional regulator
MEPAEAQLSKAPQGGTTYDLAVRIGTAWVDIRRASSMGNLREYLLGSGSDCLEQGQMDTLDLLASQPTWRMSDLAEALRVDPSTATRAVQRLVTAGLAERGTNIDDGRVVMVAINDAGRARHHDVHQRRAALMTHMLRAFTREERPIVADMLERFVVAIDEFFEPGQPGHPAPPEPVAVATSAAQG